MLIFSAFQMDLTYGPASWCLVRDEAKAALYCFDRATTIRPDHYVLLVEYATVAYSLHSFFSRSLKHVSFVVQLFSLILGS